MLISKITIINSRWIEFRTLLVWKVVKYLENFCQNYSVWANIYALTNHNSLRIEHHILGHSQGLPASSVNDKSKRIRCLPSDRSCRGPWWHTGHREHRRSRCARVTKSVGQDQRCKQGRSKLQGNLGKGRNDAHTRRWGFRSNCDIPSKSRGLSKLEVN